MRRSKLGLSIATLAVVALGAGLFGVWNRGEPREGAGEAESSGLDFQPNAEQRRKLDELRARLKQDERRFAAEDARRKDNAKLFTYMAATSDEPVVVEAALEAIQSSYSSRSSLKEAPDADLDRVLVKHLRSADPAIASSAFRAARIPLMSDAPGAELVGALLEMAREGEAPPRRQAALEALDLLRPTGRSAEVLAAFEAALSAAEAHIVSTALFALAQSGPSFAAHPERRADALGPKVTALTAHPDPGVRGRALSLLAELDWLSSAGARFEKARALLKDGHPHVRAQAAAVLGRLGEVAAVHSLIEAVSDLAPAHYDLSGWRTLDGRPGNIAHVLPGRRRVADAALHALGVLSARSGDEPAAFEPLRVAVGGPGADDSAVRKNAELARAWYERERAHIPRQPAAEL